MSLLAALAKGFGAGTVNNAQAGFAEQQRQREAEQRKEEMTEEYNRRDAQLKTQIEANQADTKARLDAQKDENKNNREHDWAMFEKRLAIETQAAAANASVRARETHAKNIMGTMDQLAKRKAELMENDKLTDDQRAVALGEIDALGYTLAADPGAQQLLGEFGGGGYASYWLSLAPEVSGKGGSDGGGEKGGSVTAPPGQVRTPDALRRLPEPAVPMRRFFNDARDGVNTQASAAFSNENLSGVLGEAERRAKINAELQKRARTYQDGALSSNPAMSSFAGMQK